MCYLAVTDSYKVLLLLFYIKIWQKVKKHSTVIKKKNPEISLNLSPLKYEDLLSPLSCGGPLRGTIWV